MERVSRRKNKVTPIARKRHNYVYLLLSVLFGILTSYIFLTFPPNYKFLTSNLGVPIFPIFFASLIILIFSFLTFIFIKKIQGIVVSVIFSAFLVLRLIGLTHWIFALLLLALLITIEVFLYKQK